jgi:hypothetical protein
MFLTGIEAGIAGVEVDLRLKHSGVTPKRSASAEPHVVFVPSVLFERCAKNYESLSSSAASPPNMKFH